MADVDRASVRRLLIEWCVIAGLAVALTVGLVLTGGTSRIDNAIYDVLVRLKTPVPSDRIILVTIDDSSIAEIGPWPWSRDIHARAIDSIAEAGPAAILYDILFTEPASDPRQDVELGNAIQARPVALPMLLTAPGTNGRPFDLLPPIEPLRRAGAAIGHVALPHSGDGRIRGALLQLQEEGRDWPLLAELAYRISEGAPSPASARARERNDPLVLVPFAGSGNFREVPFKDVLTGRVPAEFLEDRIVLVGVTAGGLGDRHQVAGAGTLPGVEVQANVIEALLQDRFLREAPLSVRVAASALPCLILLLLFWYLRPTAALWASGMMLLLAATAPVVFVLAGWWLPPTPAILGLLIVYPLWGWRRLQAVDRAITSELALFGGSGGARPRGAALDPAGRNAAELSHSISALRDLKRLVSDTIEGVSDPLIVTTMSGDIILTNARGKEVLHEDLRQDSLAQLLDSSAPQADLVLADGRTFSPRLAPLADAKGEQRGWILLLADITAIRNTERDREEALEFLSHDMRAPQSAIIHLLEGAPKSSIPEDLSSRIAYQARRTLALADDFVQLARLRVKPFAPEETNPCDALIEAMDAAWPLANKRRMRLVHMGTSEGVWVLGEHDALTRAFFNLIDNAIKFGPEGSEVRCTVVANTSDMGPYIDISIEDRGPGVAMERLDKLFEPFGPVEQRGLSAGLGLSYVFAVARRHGGSLSYDAAEPSGARFTVRLPTTSPS